MKETARVGLVTDLWRFPVKSMQGERIAESAITSQGMLGDRAFALLDNETGLIVFASNTRLFPNLLSCHATFVEPPTVDRAPPPVRITLADGATVTSDSADCSRELSAHFRRDVTLTRTAPESYKSAQAAFFAEVGLDLTAPADSFVDFCPLSIITTATLDRLARSRSLESVDVRRFRMNIIVRTEQHGFVENGWVGRRISLGPTVRVDVTMPDPRCVVTTLPQDDLPKDPGMLRTIAQENSLRVGEGGALPCAGVYARVEAQGMLRVGDQVRVG